MFPKCKFSCCISFRLKKEILKETVFISFGYRNPLCFTFTSIFFLMFFIQQQGAKYKKEISLSFFAIKKKREKTTHEFTYIFRKHGTKFNAVFVFILLLYKKLLRH